MKVSKLGTAAVLSAALGLTAYCVGCGGKDALNSGANSQTYTRVKPEKAESSNAASEKPASEKGGNEAVAAGGFGTVKGRVVFVGTPPVLQPLVTKGQNVKDAICAKVGIPDEKLVVDSSGGVANVVVFLPKAPKGVAVPPMPSEIAKFDNKGCHFVPHVLLLRVGQTMKIMNDDGIAHNTHTHPERSQSFNQTIPKEGADVTYERPEPEPCPVTCDIHAWMHGWNFPLDHPWAAVSGPDGTFEIKNVPAGTHTFRVWAEGATGKYLNRNLAVTVKPGETAQVDIKYDASQYGG